VGDKLKYPVKYGIMPIKEQTGWNANLNYLEREYADVAYIVSRCFIISEMTNYKSDGSKRKSYEVVFPCQINKVYHDMEMETPEYDFEGKCSNSIKIKEVFSSFAEAKTRAQEMNHDLLRRKIMSVPFEKAISEFNKHQDLMDKYAIFEKGIEMFYSSDKSLLDEGNVEPIKKLPKI
jgi:hypothetical protein